MISPMVDVPIHQEDLAVQRTPLIDPVISMVTDHTSSCLNVFNLLLERHFKRSLEVLVGARKTVMDKRLLQRISWRDLPRDNQLVSVEVLRSVLTDPEDQAKMEMEIPRSSGVNSPPNAHT
ncbi:hypothetical protein Tco_1198823 [Tanacetum coccineum]